MTVKFWKLLHKLITRLSKHVVPASYNNNLKSQLTPDINNYTKVLRGLFEPQSVSIYEYACALLRVGGLETEGWDPLVESKEVFQDTFTLSQINLDKYTFSDKEKTKVRLMLWGYAHLLEMDAPYSVIANLLEIRNGGKYSWDPFWGIRLKKKNNMKKQREVVDLVKGPIPVFPAEKIGRIKALSKKANIPQIGFAFDDFYFPILRNSIDHSDYILHNNEFHIHKGRIKDPNTGTYTSIIPYSRLFEIIRKTYAFYSSFFSLEEDARRSFNDLRGYVFPFDKSLKGLLEFKIKEDGSLIGFYVHWPNKHSSCFVRDEKGCNCCNIRLGIDLTVNFFVGEYFKPHSTFSSLLPPNKNPLYNSSIYKNQPLKWANTYYRI